tara:strand:+ start:850 stop:1581 length:732 start_codon:yes stop_codon:yes gene_type:complete
MRKNVEKMSFNFSPNFDLVKRHGGQIKYLIFHYTGMRSDKSAIKKLTDINSKVSCHFYITEKGNLIRMVPDLYIAWHAGKSSWRNHKQLNKYSIGIEISNPGHDHNYISYKKKQMETLVLISRKLINKYKINKKNVLGHSDIAPVRKKDPGEKFPWKNLAKKKIGIWHNLKIAKSKKMRNIKFLKKKEFFNELKLYGYDIKFSTETEKKKIVKNFQRHFRPEIVNGKLDKECFLIIKALNSMK